MKRYAILLAALLLLALCAGCGRQAAEPETLADYMAALTADDVTDWNTEQYPDITLGRLVAAMNRAAAHQIPQAGAVAAGDSADKQSWSVFFTDAGGRGVMLTCNDAAADIVQLSVLDAANTRPFTDGANAFFQDEALYGLVRHAQDSRKLSSPEDSVQYVLQLIGWPEKAELTTRTFTFDYLKVQVTNVYQTGKRIAREDEDQTYEYDVYVVAPGATLTVLESAYIEDCEGETYAGWHYYSPEDGAGIRFSRFKPGYSSGSITPSVCSAASAMTAAMVSGSGCFFPSAPQPVHRDSSNRAASRRAQRFFIRLSRLPARRRCVRRRPR